MTTGSPQQFVTLVGSGGTPVRLADAKGRPYPTTGYGALVFSVGATLENATLTGTRLSVEGINFAEAAGSVNAYTATFDASLTLRAGTPITINFPVTNTGPSVLNGVAIHRRDGSQLIGGELIADLPTDLVFDGAYFRYATVAPATTVAAFAGTDTQTALTPEQFHALTTPGLGTPDCAIVYYGDGTLAVSLPIVSKKAYQIRQVLDVGGLTAIRLRQKPAATITAQLAVRVDCGIHGETYGAHQADGNWAVTPGADPFTYVLQGCPYVAGSVFQIGHCYEVGSTMPDCAAEINRLLSYGFTGRGNVSMILPTGGMYQKTSGIALNSTTTMRGQSSASTFIFLADKVDQPGNAPSGANGINHMISTGYIGGPPYYQNVVGLHIEGLTLHGNRTRQGYTKGQHAIDLGGDTDTGVPLTLVRLIDVFTCGSAGYGMSGGGRNSKTEFLIRDGGFWGSDGDSEDFKNRTNLSYNITNMNMSFMYWALGGQGTNLSWANPNGNAGANYLCLLSSTGSVDPIHTDSGSSIATISKDVLTFVPWQSPSLQYQKPLVVARAGERLQLSGVTSFNGVTFSGSFNILGFDPVSGWIQFETNQVASATGNGGGSAVSVFNANVSIGDRIVDMRGLNQKVLNCSALGWFNGRSGFNQRFGAGVNNAQIGGVNCVVDNCSGFDTSPDWIADLPSLSSKCRGFLNLTGTGARATNNSFVTQTGGVGIDLANTSTNAYLSGNIIKGCDIGAVVGGSNHTFIGNNFINCIIKGIEDNGGGLADIIGLGPDPATPLALAGIAVLFETPYPHGHLTGQNVRFSGFANAANGITIRASNVGAAYSLTSVPTPTSFTINADGSAGATNLLPFGGSSVDARFDGSDTSNKNNRYIGNRIIFEDGVVPGAAWEYAIDIGNSGGAHSGLSLNTAVSYTAIDVVVPRNAIARDNGVGTVWGPGNTPYTYIPNTTRLDVLEAPTIISRQSTGPLLGPAQLPYIITKESSAFIVTNLGAYSTLIISGFGFMHDNASSQNWGVLFSVDNGVSWVAGGYSRYGLSGGTSRLLITGSLPAATRVGFEMIVHNFNQSKILTYCMIAGGPESATPALVGPGLVTPSTLSFNAISIGPAAGNIQPGASLSIQGIPYGRP